MHIREYKASDKEVCLQIVKSNIPEYFSEEDYAKATKWFESIDFPNFYIIYNDNHVIGFGGFSFENNQAKLLFGLIHKQYHKQGYGKILSEFRINKIWEINPEITIYLETTEKTFGFFERLGFKTVKIIPGHYYGNFDMYEMILDPKINK